MFVNRVIRILELLAAILCLSAPSGVVELESFTYRQDFETRELSAWASYPLWQDTAYDPNFRVDTIIPGDPNISIVQKVIPYTHVDNYAGAQKKLDMYLTPESRISLRYYLKTHLPVTFLKVRLAAGPDGKVDYTITNPPANRWERITVTCSDFIGQNPQLAGRKMVKVNALAVLAKVPDADPAMPFYLGLDDITFEGARAVDFAFAEPVMHKLSEWKPYIPARHYRRSDTITVSGQWNLDADSVSLTVTPFTDRLNEVYRTILNKGACSLVHKETSLLVQKDHDTWSASFKLTLPPGLYLGTLAASKDGAMLSSTEFTFFIARDTVGGDHPRLWFDKNGKQRIEERLISDRFKTVAESIRKAAQEARTNNPIESIVWEMDQFHTRLHTGNSLPSIYPWFTRINAWRDGVYNSALAYALLGDEEAGAYGRELMVKLSTFPYWLHPWFIERGRHTYYPIGEFGMEYAIGYDLLYGLLDEHERKAVRDAMMKNVILGCHEGYVEDDLVTSNTSNWVAHITGGSLMCLAAMYGDDQGYDSLEPFFTGAVMKDYDLIQKVFDREGAYGEGYGYYDFSMLSWSKSLPAVENVFNIDMSGKINRSYYETVWAGIIKDKQHFYFGDSGGNLGPHTNWAWLLPKYRDPLLGWLYNHLKEGETFMDVLYETEDVPRDDPFDENPVRLFPEAGTTVFKSGWEPDDFVFVMRTGAFYNHQHLDQGSFWLSDHGNSFIEERHGSTYYADPLYQPWYTQPVAHSTILINGNHQSQRVGDPLRMAEGFNDHAFIHHFLDGKHAAFSSGDIGRLYWGVVKSMRRNVLYLKPRTVLMVDTIVPGEKDADVTLLYQTARLDDISPGNTMSSITVDSREHAIEDPNKFRGEVTRTTTVPTEKNILFIRHLAPKSCRVEAVETPHYLNTLQNTRPLEREGMLTVTARTAGRELVMANLLTSTSGEVPHIDANEGDSCITGMVNGSGFAFPKRPDHRYTTRGFETDALALTWNDGMIFAALFRTLSANGRLLAESPEPLTCELNGNTIRYYSATGTEAVIGISARPAAVSVNGKTVRDIIFDAERKAVTVQLPAGEGVIEIH